jgi:hypothetical protein
MVMLDGVKVVDHFESGIFSAKVIDATQVCQIVEEKIRGIVKIGHYLRDPRFLDEKRNLMPELYDFYNFRGKL